MQESLDLSSKRQPHLAASLPTAALRMLDIGTELSKIQNGVGKPQKNTFISHQILHKPDFCKGFAAHPCPAGSLWDGSSSSMALAIPQPLQTPNLSTASAFHNQGVMRLSSFRRKGQTSRGLGWSSIRGSAQLPIELFFHP